MGDAMTNLIDALKEGKSNNDNDMFSRLPDWWWRFLTFAFGAPEAKALSKSRLDQVDCTNEHFTDYCGRILFLDPGI
jgi:hypothetical protein